MKTIEIKQTLAEEIVDQLEGAQKDCYVQSTENVINDLKQALRIHDVVGRSGQLVCVHPYSDVYQSDTECYCEKCGKDLTEAN